MTTDQTPRDTAGRPVYTSADAPNTTPVAASAVPHNDALVVEKERFGGIKFGSAFFGWLTALGTVVFLSAIVGAIGAAVGLETGMTVDDAAEAATGDPATAGIIGIIAIAVVLFVAYLAGGYVAGRMARFSGALQGVAVWLWGIIIAILVAVLALLVGSQWNILGALDSFRIPVSAESATSTGILTAVVAAAIALGGAVLGGVAGMRYHRKVDRAGFDVDDRVARP